jgi:RimJ/RimL family protein N-acetyltransferase
MFDGPFPGRASFDAYLAQRAVTDDPFAFAIVDAESKTALGMAALMRIEPAHRVIEIGGIMYSRALQQTRGATEAMYLLAHYVFDDLGYRRYEWKCNARHAGSRNAALRLGFSFEGIFRQHMILKGQSRDTSWYAMIDADWPARKAEFERWLAPGNFDDRGGQRRQLGGSRAK